MTHRITTLLVTLVLVLGAVVALYTIGPSIDLSGPSPLNPFFPSQYR